MAEPACRVLLIEDNADSRESMTILLRMMGHEVQEAADGREGLDKALSWAPENAVVDIGLPILDGYQVARGVKSVLGNHIRLIALTAYCQEADRKKAFDAGFDEFVAKPADTLELSRLLLPMAS
jgi:two-component system, sensor histidine kinase